VFPCEDRYSSEAFENNAAQTPHVNGSRVRDAQHNLGGSVESALDVRVVPFLFEATAAEVNQLHLGFVRLPQQNVLRLQVAMHNAKFEQLL
jgi:hypothetical protein